MPWSSPDGVHCAIVSGVPGETGASEKMPLLVIQRRDPTLDLPSWVAENRQALREQLHKYGALLFRGFTGTDPAAFEQTVTAISTSPLVYGERSSPRHAVQGRVYTATDYPRHFPIFLHNEQSYTLKWCGVISFLCKIVAKKGGQTPLADTRRILSAIDPNIVDRFRERGYMLVRNYGTKFGMGWRESFQTDSPAEVEEYCRNNRIDYEWLSADRLRTRQVRQLLHRHPVSNELLWFNHCTFFHISTLPSAARKFLFESVEERDLPNQTYYGNGDPIESEVIAHLQQAYLNNKVIFDWEQDDVLVVDNMLCSHGREPFRGNRSVLATLSEPIPCPE